MQLVTIIIPTHNYARYIAETLDSVLVQTYPNWECIIIDDGSVDNTRSIVGDYVARDHRFRYVYQDCQGVSKARNAGLALALGQYVQFLDADDLLYSEKIERQLYYLQHNPLIDIVYSESKYFANNDKQKLSYSFDMKNVEWMPKVDDTPGAALLSLAKSNIMPIQAPLSRISLLNKVGPFNPAMRHCEDWDYWFRCVVAGGEIRFLNEPAAMSLIRVHNVSASHNVVAMKAGWEAMMKNILAYINTKPVGVSQIVITDILKYRSVELIKNKNYKEGLILYSKTIGKVSSGNITFKDVLYWLRH